MESNQREQYMKAWCDKRDTEICQASSREKSVSQDGKTISTDGKCLVCGSLLFLIEEQESLNRDWCECSYCGLSQPATKGVVQR